METIIVKMGEVQVARDAILATFGVGSCVAIVLFDRESHIGGMAHVMLTSEKATSMQIAAHPFRYVEKAIPELMTHMLKAGAKKYALQAFLAGGAQMFSLYRDPSNAIGPQNIAMAQQVLASSGIPITKEETGGKSGRNVRFDCSTGAIMIDAKG